MRRKIEIQENDDGSFSFSEVSYRMEKMQDPGGRGIFMVPVPERSSDGARETAAGLLDELGRVLGVRKK